MKSLESYTVTDLKTLPVNELKTLAKQAMVNFNIVKVTSKAFDVRYTTYKRFQAVLIERTQ